MILKQVFLLLLSKVTALADLCRVVETPALEHAQDYQNSCKGYTDILENVR